MNIGQAARLSSLSSKTIRYYEDIGLVIPRRQASNDYRDYNELDVEQLRFLQRARCVGFSLDECRALLELYRNPTRQSVDVKQLVLEKIKQLDEQLQVLQSMQATLARMVEHCAGDETPQCAIIESLSRSDLSFDQPPVNMAFRLVENGEE